MASGGTAVSGSYEVLRSQFYVWGIAVVFQIAGGGIAGMNTRSGAVYGFWAGLLAAVVQTHVQALGDLSLRIHEFPAGLLGLSAAEGSPAALLIQGVHIAIVAALGGWLGSQILPVFQPKSAVNPGAD
jgi:hypothetical protein